MWSPSSRDPSESEHWSRQEESWINGGQPGVPLVQVQSQAAVSIVALSLIV